MSAPSDPTKENASLERGEFSATQQKRNTHSTAEKKLATIRAKLWLAGGQTLQAATDGVFFVVTTWEWITKFNGLAELQVHADRGSR